MADIKPGDVVVDPMCGGGSIGIEVCKVVFACVYLYIFTHYCVHQINDLCSRVSHSWCIKGLLYIYVFVAGISTTSAYNHGVV